VASFSCFIAAKRREDMRGWKCVRLAVERGEEAKVRDDDEDSP
jgi:hypothetical protein